MSASIFNKPEPIYCREQIKIPPQLPDILKNYSKHIIRTQPADILAASAEYFRHLCKKRHSESFTASTQENVSNARIGEQQLETLYSKCFSQSSKTISIEKIWKISEQSQIPKERTEEVLILGGWATAKEIPWLEFWSLTCAASTETFLSTISLVSHILSNNDTLLTAHIISIAQFLGSKDPEVNADVLTEVLKDIEAAGETISPSQVETTFCKHLKTSA